MIPEDRLSTQTIYAPLLLANPQPSDLESRQMGGVGLNDPSEGLWVKVWTCSVVLSGDPYVSDLIQVGAEDVPAVTILSEPSVTQVSLAFDQNMRPTIAYVSANTPYLYWYDSLLEEPVITELDPGVTTPRVTLDDHRDMQDSTSDIILTYIRDGNLYFRQQRDRYQIEYLLYPDLNTVLINPSIEYVAMNEKLRLQWRIRGNFYGG